jgi:hypothetical protein
MDRKGFDSASHEGARAAQAEALRRRALGHRARRPASGNSCGTFRAPPFVGGIRRVIARDGETDQRPE